MNLLVVTREFPPYVVGGISYHLSHLYSAMAALGHKVHIIAGRYPESKYDPDVRISDKLNVEWVDLPTIKANHIIFQSYLKYKLSRIDLAQYDALMAHTEIPFKISIPVISKRHDCQRESRKYYRKDMSSIKRKLDSVLEPTRRRVDRRSLKYTDFNIFNSKVTKDAWEFHFNESISGEVIHNGVDRDIFYPRKIDFDKKYLLFVGSSYRKGLNRVKKYSRISPFPIYIVGPSEVNSENIKAVGRCSQEQLAKLFSGAYATIHPARFEPFGNVILESLSCGTPVIISESCGASELVTESSGVTTIDIDAGLNKIESEVTKNACLSIASRHTWLSVACKTSSTVKNSLK